MSKREERPPAKKAAPQHRHGVSALFEDNPDRAELTSGQGAPCWCGFATLTRKYQFCISDQADCQIIREGEAR